MASCSGGSSCPHQDQTSRTAPRRFHTSYPVLLQELEHNPRLLTFLSKCTASTKHRALPSCSPFSGRTVGRVTFHFTLVMFKWPGYMLPTLHPPKHLANLPGNYDPSQQGMRLRLTEVRWLTVTRLIHGTARVWNQIPPVLKPNIFYIKFPPI